jgi:hypothetical protein
MGIALTTTAAFCLWVVLWAIGLKGFDGLLVATIIVLVAATLRSLAQYLPGSSEDKSSEQTGGW